MLQEIKFLDIDLQLEDISAENLTRVERKFLKKLRKDVETSLDEIALYKQGKKKLKTIQELLSEL